MDLDVDFPDDADIARLRDALQRDRSALDRIGLGLRALHNHPLFEGLPDEFRRLIERLQRQEDGAHRR